MMSVSEKEQAIKDNYDVIVVGAGGAGLTAAIQAKLSGANPVVLEKTEIVRGNTKSASAGMNASETVFQKKAGIVDSNENFFNETLIGGKETNDQKLLRYFVEHSASAIEWLDSLGIRLDNLTQVGGMSVKRTHRPIDGSAIGSYLMNGLLKTIEDLFIPIFTSVEVKNLIISNGIVSGVEIMMNHSEKKQIQAKAVIVTTGGFGANKKMIKEYVPKFKDLKSTNQKGTMGEGLKMLKDIGASLRDLNEIQIHPTVHATSTFLITEAVRGEGAVLINQEGRRFCNEMDTRDKVSKAILEQKGQRAFLFFDEKVKEQVAAVDFYLFKGFVKKADTLKELASLFSLPLRGLQEAVQEWNEMVKNKKDINFSRTTAIERELSESPYYMIEVTPGIHHTMGGVVINQKTEVKKDDGTVIKGCYAAGEVVGGLHGKNRIGGNAIAEIIVFGRQAGKEAAIYSAEIK